MVGETMFSVDGRTLATLSVIRATLGAASNAEVLRRAIELLGVAALVTGHGGQLLIRSEDGREKEILLV